MLISLAILVAVLILAWWFAKQLADLTRKLALEVSQIRRLNFDPHKITRSNIREIDVLSVSMDEVRHSIRRFAELSTAITCEQGFDSLAKIAVRATCNACNARYRGLWLVSRDLSSLNLIHEQIRGAEIPDNSKPRTNTIFNTDLETGLLKLSLEDSGSDTPQAETYAVNEQCSIIIDDVSRDNRYHVATEHLDSIMFVPLITAEGKVVGLLQLGARGRAASPSLV